MDPNLYNTYTSSANPGYNNVNVNMNMNMNMHNYGSDMMGMDNNNYHPEAQHLYYPDQHGMQMDQGEIIPPSASASSQQQPGSYYPFTPPYVPHIQSAPISSVAFHPTSDAIYIAGHTITLSKKRHHATYSNAGTAPITNGRSYTSHHGSSSSSLAASTLEQKASMVATHLIPDGTLYSAFAAAEQASMDILDRISMSFYGSKVSNVASGSSATNTASIGRHSYTGSTTSTKIPNHAYRPPYGIPRTNSTVGTTLPFDVPVSQMGINKILPFTSSSNNSNNNNNDDDDDNEQSYMCTISPSSVRVHTTGGLLISENQTEGMVCGTFHPGGYSHEEQQQSMSTATDGWFGSSGMATHVTVGGISFKNNNNSGSGGTGRNLHCMDLYSDGLKIISSYAIQPSSTAGRSEICVSDLVTNYEKGNVISACSDGTVRIFDGSWRGGGKFIECATVKAHAGGVTNCCTKGNLICTTGYSSRQLSSSASGSPYAYPDQHVLIFDIRMLGRGGIAHPFSGLRGGPRFVSFLDDDASKFLYKKGEGDEVQPRILVGSGQTGGGLQILTPFESLSGSSGGGDVEGGEGYIQLPLAEEECITAMTVRQNEFAIGTSDGNLLQYQMAEFVGDTDDGDIGAFHSSSGNPMSNQSGIVSNSSADEPQSNITTKKKQLMIPNYIPDVPELCIDPMNLQAPNVQNQSNHGGSHSTFNSYILQHPSTLSYLHNAHQSTDPPVLLPSEERILTEDLNALVATKEKNHDFLTTIPTSQLKMNVFGGSGRNSGRGGISSNPNQFLFGKKAPRACYDVDADPRKKFQRRRRRDGALNTNENKVPKRYKCKYRQPYSLFSAFDFASLNETVYPGWDYAPSMPNAYASPVLMMLYFTPEIRSAMLSSQLLSTNSLDQDSDLTRQKQKTFLTAEDMMMSSELGFLFHQMNSLAAHAMAHPKAPDNRNSNKPVVQAFVPSNFLSAFSVLPEASALALLDGEAAAVEVARRPEAFYRFIVHHLDRELNSDIGVLQQRNGKYSRQTVSNNKRNAANRGKEGGSKLNLIDSLQGMNSVSMNEFITGSGPPTVSSTRSYTVDLAYDTFLNRNEENQVLPAFGDVLRYSLCKDVRLRAWCQSTKSYETVEQRKIITSLPGILSISCACAGNNSEDRISLWRKSGQDSQHWLPEVIQVEIEENGNVITRQLVSEDDNKWETYTGNQLSEPVSKILRDAASDDLKEGKRCRQFRLDAVLSFIRDEDAEEGQGRDGHHVLHMRIPKICQEEVLQNQIDSVKRCMEDIHNEENDDRTMLNLVHEVSSNEFQNRIQSIQQNLDQLKEGPDSEWVLFNGPVVSKTIVDDARAFHVSFKEPCIVLFRQVDLIPSSDITSKEKKIETPRMSSIPKSGRFPSQEIPGKGDLVAFDAEFVSVQNEESQLTATGSKITVREGRNALARMSLIDCETDAVFIDDHVFPCEPIVDCLTRFSGIRPTDLDPRTSPHKLISTKNAYLKMRYLVDRGCIFVGHGLNQDFRTVNLHVPPCQIIDTLLIFHQPNRRFISLRFLVNYLLGRDMQQDVHDSVEDARAAYDLYLVALDLKEQGGGKFDKVLNEIYEHGQITDWKVGVDEKGRS